MVSACLLGQNCKYNGGNNYSEKVAEFIKGHEVIPVCPEVEGVFAELLAENGIKAMDLSELVEDE